jgi:tetratricopeptide (TPR) repeat protein
MNTDNAARIRVRRYICVFHGVGFLLVSAFALLPSLQAQSLRDAARLDAEGKCTEAEQYYRAELAKGSASQALLNNAGNHYLICGQPAKAHTCFEALLKINPAHQNANLQLARIAAEQKQGEKALAYLSKVTEADPTVLLLRAEALHWAGRKTESLSTLDRAAKESSGDPRLLYLLGISCARLALYDRAETAFNDALVLAPGNFDILFNLGRAAARARDYDRAQRALEAALKIRPENVDLLLELASVWAARQDYIRAFFLLVQARQKAPNRADVRLMLAHAAQDAGYFEDSAAAYDEYLQLRPDDDTARRDRALAAGQTESRREEAGKELAWYLKKHPDDPQGHYIYARIFWWNKPEESLAHLSEAARLAPDSVQIRFSRAWIWQRLGQPAESLTDLKAANRLDPGNVRILDLMALAYLSLEQPAEAEKALQQALAKAPDDPEAVMHMGRALMALGREDEAQSFMMKYQKIRPQALPGLRKFSGMTEMAALSAPEQREREIERFRRDAREHPDRPDYQMHLANLLLADGKREEAVREYRVLLGLNAGAKVWEQTGTFLLGVKEYALAREFLQRAAPERSSARLDLAIALFYTEGPEAALQFLGTLPKEEVTGDVLLLKANVLDAAGQVSEADRILDEGLRQLPVNPRLVQQAAVLLVRRSRNPDALALLEKAIRANPDDSDLPLTRAIVLGMMNQTPAAEKALREIEASWPEWDRAYLVHGLLLEQTGRSRDARQKLQTAAALGSQDPSLRCALARLEQTPNPGSECTCLTGLAQLLIPGCPGQP